MQQPTTILLIEDNADIRENTCELLELAGYKVLSAANGVQGISLIKLKMPDLIVCDIMMPELDGYGVLHLLSKDNGTAHIPFIFLTAKTERSDMRKGMDLGADDYITKPFDKTELLNAIDSRLRKKQIQEMHYQSNLDGLNNYVENVHGKEALETFTKKSKVLHFKRKQSIFNEGNFPQGLYYLMNGKAKIYSLHQQGKEFITQLIKPGDFFGYNALLQNSVYEESAEALEDSDVAMIITEEFNKLLQGDTVVTGTFLRILAGNIIHTQQKLLDIAYSSVRKRVANGLVQLHDKYHESNSGEQFTINMTREDMANIAGIATESLIRTLSDFKDEQLISIAHGRVTIIDIERLRKMKN